MTCRSVGNDIIVHLLLSKKYKKKEKELEINVSIYIYIYFEILIRNQVSIKIYEQCFCVCPEVNRVIFA